MDNFAVAQVLDDNNALCAYRILMNPGDEGDQPEEGMNDFVQVLLDSRLFLLMQGKPLFIEMKHLDEKTLHKLSFLRDNLVLEFTRDYLENPVLFSRVRTAKILGYKLSLDLESQAFRYSEHLKIIDFISIDLKNYNRDNLQAIQLLCEQNELQAVARDVDSHESQAIAAKLGFRFFSGDYLFYPASLNTDSNGVSHSMLGQALCELNKPDLDASALEQVISSDAVIAYQLFKLANSAAYGMKRNFEALRDVLVFIGVEKVRTWANVLILLKDSGRNPRPAMIAAMIRAKMCELFYEERSVREQSQAFTCGLFSMLDSMMEQPLPQLLEEIPLAREIEQAILHGKGDLGQALSLVSNYQKGQFNQAQHPECEPGLMRSIHLEALKWTDDILQSINGKKARFQQNAA